jgi:hypothetical protein
VSSAAFDTTAAMVSEEALAEREHARLGHIGAEDDEFAQDMEGGTKGNAKVYSSSHFDRQSSPLAKLGVHFSYGLPHFRCRSRSVMYQIHKRSFNIAYKLSIGCSSRGRFP